jgi:hypothetical protein
MSSVAPNQHQSDCGKRAPTVPCVRFVGSEVLEFLNTLGRLLDPKNEIVQLLLVGTLLPQHPAIRELGAAHLHLQLSHFRNLEIEASFLLAKQ